MLIFVSLLSQPPSPTTIKEQVQCDATTMASTTISDESDSSGSQTWDASFVGGLTCDPAQDCETTKRFKELGDMINTKIVELNGKFFNELGDMASTTLEKNRNEMGKMIEKKWNTKDELYDSPFVSCSDMKACMTETEHACRCEDTTELLPSKYRSLAV